VLDEWFLLAPEFVAYMYDDRREDSRVVSRLDGWDVLVLLGRADEGTVGNAPLLSFEPICIHVEATSCVGDTAFGSGLTTSDGDEVDVEPVNRLRRSPLGAILLKRPRAEKLVEFSEGLIHLEESNGKFVLSLKPLSLSATSVCLRPRCLPKNFAMALGSSFSTRIVSTEPSRVSNRVVRIVMVNNADTRISVLVVTLCCCCL
jgi:hypothetical protein